jgi:hypothetical protein
VGAGSGQRDLGPMLWFKKYFRRFFRLAGFALNKAR